MLEKLPHLWQGEAQGNVCYEHTAGAEACLVSTDLGQAANPPVAEGLADFAQRLLGAGFSVDEVRRMAVDNPGRLLATAAPPVPGG